MKSKNKPIPFDLDNLETSATVMVGRDIIRDQYILPDKTRIYDHWVSPWNIFQKPFGFAVIDWILPTDNKAINEVLKDYNITLNTDWYTEEGFGMPEVKAEVDSLKAACQFLANEREVIQNLLTKGD